MATLPDDHTRTLALTLNVAQFRELMRSVAYRAADLERTDPKLSARLDAIKDLVGDAWNAAEPEPEPETHTLCRTCGSLAHERDACTAEGLAPGAYWRAWKRHVGHLPGNPSQCEAAGHCGHAPCCNCSGIMPDPDTYARQTAEILAQGKQPGSATDTALASLGTSLEELRSAEASERARDRHRKP